LQRRFALGGERGAQVGQFLFAAGETGAQQVGEVPGLGGVGWRWRRRGVLVDCNSRIDVAPGFELFKIDLSIP